MFANRIPPRPAVVFDLGGVLLNVDFMRACKRLEAAGAAPAEVIHAAIRQGREKTRFETGQVGAEEFAERFCAAIGPRLPFPEFADIWCDIFTEQHEVTGLLDAIADRANLVLLSNTDPLHIAWIRSNYAFLEKFERLVLSYEVGHVKPGRQIFERALEFAAPAGRMLYFDDVPEFVAAARACGLPARQFVDAATLQRDLEQFGVI